MKTSPQHHDPAADEQAALWAARLDGDSLNQAQRAELDAWLAQHPAHRTLLSQYCQFSADLEEQIPVLVSAGAVSLPVAAPVATPRASRWTFPRIATMALAAAAAVAVTFVVLKPGANTATIANAPGQRGGVHTLADGTRVELNANTSLRFENNAADRRVRLGGGEAFFRVAKDPARPFFVETPSGSVRVTGTTFNVRTESAATAFEVTVIEGSVQVQPSVTGTTAHSAPVSLVAGDQFTARMDGQTKRALSEAELDDVLAWRKGLIVFNNIPLQDAAARFAHYHGRAIHVDPAVARKGVGGTHKIDDLKGFLSAMEMVLEIRYSQSSSGAMSLGPR